MSRLADRLLRGKVTVAPWYRGDTTGLVADFKRQVSESPVFVIDNVAEYLYAGTDQEHWHAEDFPNVAPPFPQFFMEHKKASRVVSEVYGVLDASTSMTDAVGFLVQAVRREDGGWGMVGLLVFEENREVVLSMIAVTLALAADGSIEEIKTGVLTGVPIAEDSPEADYLRSLGEPLSGAANAFLLGLTFLNAKNVEVETIEPPPKLSRKHEKRYHRPLFSYRVLEIQPMRRVLETEGRVNEVGLAKALHICRGHFKTYSEDKPLFGKVSGTFWWESHVRGTFEAGVAAKDYRVLPIQPGEG